MSSRAREGFFAKVTNVPPQIIDNANEILEDLKERTHTKKRGDNLVAIRAVLIYEAYRSNSITVDPEEVWRDAGGQSLPWRMISKRMNDAYKHLGTLHGYQPVQFHETVEDYIRVYFPCTDMGSEMLDVFLRLGNTALENIQDFREKPPQTIAKAVMLSYAQKRGISLGKGFETLVGSGKRYDKLIGKI